MTPAYNQEMEIKRSTFLTSLLAKAACAVATPAQIDIQMRIVPHYPTYQEILALLIAEYQKLIGGELSEGSGDMCFLQLLAMQQSDVYTMLERLDASMCVAIPESIHPRV
jgi:hypothetical protein